MAELTSLIDPTQTNPALPQGHPFNISGLTFYWSATTDAEDSTHAWGVEFGSGGVGSNGRTDGRRVWCVLGGMNADQY